MIITSLAKNFVTLTPGAPVRAKAVLYREMSFHLVEICPICTSGALALTRFSTVEELGATATVSLTLALGLGFSTHEEKSYFQMYF